MCPFWRLMPPFSAYAGGSIDGGCGRVWEDLGENFLAAGVRRVQSPPSVFLFTVLFTVTGFIPFF